MIDAVVAWSIRCRGAVFVASAALAAFGAWAFARLPIDAIPDLSENQQLVYADWPGRSPWEIDEQVTRPLALHLQGIAGVRTVRGSSEVDFALVHLIFDEGVGYAAARARVAERLATLPPMPSGAAVRIGPDGLPTGQIFWYTLVGGGYDLGELRALQDATVGPQLASVPGVAEVASVGGFKPEFRIEIDPAQLRARGGTLQEIAKALDGASGSVGGLVLGFGNTEFVARAGGVLDSSPSSESGSPHARARRLTPAIEALPVETAAGNEFKLGDVAQVTRAGGPRRGVLEMDGNEVVGGVVLMRTGENPRAVCERLRARIVELNPALPTGVRIVPAYDRTTLVDAAVGTVFRTLWEAMAVAALAVLVVLLHWRTVFAVVAALPLAVLASFAGLWSLREVFGWSVDVNIMTLAGLAVSIGVLVDSSMVLVENAMVRIRERSPDGVARGDTRAAVLQACRFMARPVVYSILIMLLSFLPLFALGGIEGRMFRPLVLAKSLALAAVAVLAVTLVPALCTVFVRGRLRRETDSWIVRATADVYRPLLTALLDRPLVMLAIFGVTLLVGFAPVGDDRPIQVVMFGLATVAFLTTAPVWRRLGVVAFLAVIALVARGTMAPLGSEFIAPLDERMVMDMPITAPRASVEQATDDLKARDMLLCRFPEVAMVVGKAGRADTPTDPAPLDMIETMVDLRPAERWPSRSIPRGQARTVVAEAYRRLVAFCASAPPSDADKLVDEATDAVLPLVEVQLREAAYQSLRQFEREPGPPKTAAAWRSHLIALNAELRDRAADGLTRAALEEMTLRLPLPLTWQNPIHEIRRWRAQPPIRAAASHHGKAPPAPALPPTPELDALQAEMTAAVRASIWLAPRSRHELVGFGGELDRAMSMPGWTNVWTMPIQNRIDMLATGVNTTVGVRVLGDDFDAVVQAADLVAAAVAKVPGAADTVADPIRGKGYLDVRIDRRRASARGLSVASVAEAVEIALGGRVRTVVADDRRPRPVRIQVAQRFRGDPDAIRRLPVGRIGDEFVALGDVADVELRDGPAAVKSENGRLRSYVRFNARNRDATALVADAKLAVAAVKLPPGVHLEWTGQFEHQERARTTLLYIVPMVLAVIAFVLYWTFRDWGDALILMLAIPGALAGGVFCQWLLGVPFSVTVWVGFIACFGMATATGVVMLVFLRDAVERLGPLKDQTPATLRTAVVEGAVQRLRPKLLTEATMILGLAPMLWAEGVGSEVIRPMAAPVLGGILVADEVIDLFLPAAFLWVRRRRLEKERLHDVSE